MAVSMTTVLATCFLCFLQLGCCVATTAQRSSCRLVYDSLGDIEATQETVVVGTEMRVGFSQFQDRTRFRRLSPREYEILADSMEVLERWARGSSSTSKPSPGYFLTVSCNGATLGIINLASADKQEWQALVRLDTVLSRHFRDYLPIAEDAKYALGYGLP